MRIMVMYIRFVGPEKHPHCRGEIGFYRYVRNLDTSAFPAGLEDEFNLAWGAFCVLDVPACLKRRSRHPRASRSLCWFKPEAVGFIRTVRYLAWICDEAGYPIREVRSRAPGMIIWEDDDQIVAVPMDRFQR